MTSSFGLRQDGERERVAIVGSGVAGLVCAHVLGPHHDVTIFEADMRLGGHANTVDVDDPSVGRIGVDTGFIVHNDRNYPNLVRLFADLGVATLDTEMSFGVIDRDPTSPTLGLAYRATSPNTLFADRRNLVRPAMWRMLADIAKFFRASRSFLADPDPTLTLADFLRAGGYSRDFVELHLLPMGAAVWSAAPARFDEFPAANLLRFLDNHGLLGVRDRPQWRTIVGGSRSYVDAIAGRFPGRVELDSPVLSIERVGLEAGSPQGPVRVVTARGVAHFDRVVIATHSDQALRLLAQPTGAEQAILSAIDYQANRATLHTDTSLLPPNQRAWAAWNYERRGPDQSLATLTYDLTALQHLPGSRRYLVSLNSEAAVDPGQVLASIDYAHPVFDQAAIAAQARRTEISGSGPIHYCGAYWGYGFHEDGAASALAVCRELGVEWPHGTTRDAARSNVVIVEPAVSTETGALTSEDADPVDPDELVSV